MKKELKRAGIVLLSISIITVMVTCASLEDYGISETTHPNEIGTLSSLKQIDDYGMFQMTYHGDYGFDEFLKTGATNDSAIIEFFVKRLGIPMDIDMGLGDGCTVFVTSNEKNEVIFGRNYDFEDAPSLQLITRPKNGYASVSTVDLTFAGFSRKNLPTGADMKSFPMLFTPFLPLDGMNEKGVAIAVLVVPQAEAPYDKNKITLNTSTAIRLVLDKAATVDEAIELLKNYNIYFSGGIKCHYLIADKTGKSVIVEFWGGELVTVETVEDYQIASNFVAYKGLNIGEGYDEFIRYDAVEEAITQNDGSLTKEQTINLLEKVGIYNWDKSNRLQWSVMYNLSTLEGTIFAYRNTENLIDFKLQK